MLKQTNYNDWRARNYDPNFEIFLNKIKEKIEKDDDYLIMCVGETGTGKSHLTLHAYEYLDPINCSIENICFDAKDHATSMQNLLHNKDIRFLALDEANIQKRNSTTKFNKDLIDLYFSIRGLNFIHWWNNPSLDIIDKVFIKEKINCVIYVYGKDIKFPRHYVIFLKKDLLKMYEQFGTLTLDILKKSKTKYGFFKGYFKKYTGKLIKDYEEKKTLRMQEKVQTHFDKYADIKLFKKREIADELGAHRSTITKHIKRLKEEGAWKEGEDYINKPTGERITKEGKERFIKLYLQSRGFSDDATFN